MNENRQLSVRKAHIQRHDILGGLNPENQEVLAAKSRLVLLEEGNFVFRQGEEGTSFFALCSGSVRVSRSSPDGREAVVKILQAGEIFGEIVIFQDVPYPANARCLENASMIEVEKPVLLDLLSDPGFRNDFISTLLDKLHYLSKRVYLLGALDVEERFFQYLLDEFGPSGDYTIEISKKELASAIGTVPETLSRLIGRLGARGLIQWEGKSLRVRKDILDEYKDREGHPGIGKS